MYERVMNAANADRLENPERLVWLPPAEVLAAIGVATGMVVADVGAGTGYFSLPLAKAVGPSGRIFAVDLQEPMLALLRGKLAAPDAPANIEPVLGHSSSTTLADRSCDLVFFANVWHEIDDHSAALKECERILRGQRRLAIVDWRPDFPPPPGPPSEHRIACAQVQALLEKHGWRILSQSPIGHYSYLVLSTAIKPARHPKPKTGDRSLLLRKE